jgi:hypothetical protein
VRPTILPLFAALAVACFSACHDPSPPTSAPRRAARAGAPAAQAAPAPPPPAPAATAPMAAAVTPAALEARAADLRARLPAGFTVLVEPPFVVVGDGGPALVARHARQTVRWAVTLLKQDFFARDPDRVLDVFLFEGKDSYEKNARALFGDQPTTPYGYYSSEHGALIMNIATGGGTLVHEIVHPFVEANVPSCPAWINEGLGSLFEGSGERDGHIVGAVNWRLPGLQRAIRDKALPPFDALFASGERAFYEADPGTNYAQARYLLYWLQEHGRLQAFWKAYAAGRERDPSGREAVLEAIGEPDLAGFQRRWERWVMGLRFGA